MHQLLVKCMLWWRASCRSTAFCVEDARDIHACAVGVLVLILVHVGHCECLDYIIYGGSRTIGGPSERSSAWIRSSSCQVWIYAGSGRQVVDVFREATQRLW